jgi:hypothetical protein
MPDAHRTCGIVRDNAPPSRGDNHVDQSSIDRARRCVRNARAMKVKAGIVTGEVTEMKVTERVEAGTGRVATPAKLTGKLSLKNTSSDQSMRLVGAKASYIDLQGKPIAMEDNRTAPSIQVGGSPYSSTDRLDPGQSSSHALAVPGGNAEFHGLDLRPVKHRQAGTGTFSRETSA